MKREIFIIHGSEIIRKGLNTIIRSYFNLEITQLPFVAKLDSFSHISNAHLVVFAALQEEGALNVINRLKSKNEVDIIQIISDSNSANRASGTDGCIFMHTTGEEIHTLVSTLLQSVSDPQGEKPGNGDLSNRERDVLQLVALGHSNKEIADKLFISIHTVISHRKNITEKLGIKSISGLTVYALLNKIIDPDRINPENLI